MQDKWLIRTQSLNSDESLQTEQCEFSKFALRDDKWLNNNIRSNIMLEPQ